MHETEKQRGAILLAPILILALAAFVLIKSGAVSLDTENEMTAVCSREPGYMGAVTVYDPDGSPLYKWYSASGLPLCARLSPDGEMLAVLCAGKGASAVHIFSLHSENELSCCELPDELFFTLGWMNGKRLCLLSEERAVSVDTEGRLLSEFDFDGRYLGDYYVEDGVTLKLMSSEYGGESETLRLSGELRIRQK